MSKAARICQVDHLGGLVLRLTFDDQLVRELDLDPMLHDGILEALRDPTMFAQAQVDEITGTVAWPNGIDLDPNVLHGDFQPATGPGPRVLAERRLKPTG